jgi:hypothetical protein
MPSTVVGKTANLGSFGNFAAIEGRSSAVPRRGTGRGIATDGGDDALILASIPTADIDGVGRAPAQVPGDPFAKRRVTNRFFALQYHRSSHTSGLGLQLEAAGPDGIRWSTPDQLNGLLKSFGKSGLSRPRSDL